MKKMIAVGIVGGLLGGLVVFLALGNNMSSSQDTRNVMQLTQRIKHLEDVIARLEKSPASTVNHAFFSPDGKSIITHGDKTARVWQIQPSPHGTNPLTSEVPAVPPTASVPPGWKAREFNGVTYYMVPLAHEPHQDGNIELAKTVNR